MALIRAAHRPRSFGRGPGPGPADDDERERELPGERSRGCLETPPRDPPHEADPTKRWGGFEATGEKTRDALRGDVRRVSACARRGRRCDRVDPS